MRRDRLDAGKGVLLKRLLDKLAALLKYFHQPAPVSDNDTNGRRRINPLHLLSTIFPQSLLLNCQLPVGCVLIETVSCYYWPKLASDISDF